MVIEDWNEKYRPGKLDDILGNDKAVSDLRAWANSWEQSNPSKKGVVLVGEAGTGKTSGAHALASDFNWGIIELTASDPRNAENIRKIVMTGAIHETFTDDGEFFPAKKGGRKLIILDEADSMFERIRQEITTDKDYSDRGGKRAIIETLTRTSQPVVLIANDLYELTKGSGAAIKRLCLIVKFLKIRKPTVKRALQRIAAKEGVRITPDALDELARHSDGDLRSAINDLQALSAANEEISLDDVHKLGYRDVKSTIFDAVRDVFKSTNCKKAKEAIRDLDETPDTLILWLDENLPLEYKRPLDLQRGFDYLSRADVFLGRIRRRQFYRFWVYANELMTAGVAMAKTDVYRGWVRYSFPTWLSKMSRTKTVRQMKKNVAGKIGRHIHTSKKIVMYDTWTFFKDLFKIDHEFAINMIIKLELEKDEVAFLLDAKQDSNKVKYLMQELEEHIERPSHYIEKKPEPQETKIDVDEKKTEKEKDTTQRDLFDF
jgi:replication factor C large subunit